MDTKTPKPVKQRPKKEPPETPLKPWKEIDPKPAEKTYRHPFTPAQKRVFFDIWGQYYNGTLKNPRDGSLVDKYIVAKGIAWAAANAVTATSDEAQGQTD